jgi:hypothetical protein
MTNANEHPDPKTPTVHTLTIQVNNHDVKLANRQVTGEQIKEAAIAQGVKIKVDFKLFRVAGGTQHPVGDTEQVTVHNGEQFVCVAPDDNS